MLKSWLKVNRTYLTSVLGTIKLLSIYLAQTSTPQPLIFGQPVFSGESGVDQLVEIIKALGTPTREEIKCMNPNYTKFKFPHIKAHPWHKIFHKRMLPEAGWSLLLLFFLWDFLWLWFSKMFKPGLIWIFCCIGFTTFALEPWLKIATAGWAMGVAGEKWRVSCKWLSWAVSHYGQNPRSYIFTHWCWFIIPLLSLLWYQKCEGWFFHTHLQGCKHV